MNNKIVYTTQWFARDKQKEYPHGWGFDAPIVEFAQDVDPTTVAKICREKLSNDEFECIGAIPRRCLSFESPATLSASIVEQLEGVLECTDTKLCIGCKDVIQTQIRLIRELVMRQPSSPYVSVLIEAVQSLFNEKKNNPKNKSSGLEKAWNQLSIALYDFKKSISQYNNQGKEEKEDKL